MMKIRTRFAPSPTGFLHIGGLRTALYAYALAKSQNGDFILRVEDTDQKREVAGATEALKSTLNKFGLVWDEFYLQSNRKKDGVYEKSAKKLVAEGHAFFCDCKPKNAKEEGYSVELRDPCRDKNLVSGAIKLRVPDGETVSYFDFVHKKEISWQTNDIYDATLLKSDGFPTYHLAAMTDDIDMKITHLLRGHDWLPSTPVHLLVFKYLCSKRPEIGHLTDILSAETGKKLSKRRDSVFAEQFLDEGYLPEALLNFIMLLGWAPKDNREIFTLKEFVKNFDIKGFQEANPRFFRNKLDWLNQHYLQKLEPQGFIDYITGSSIHASSPKFKEIVAGTSSFMPSRMTTVADFDKMTRFLFETPKLDTSLFGPSYKKHLEVAKVTFESLNDWNLELLNSTLMENINKNGFKVGDFFMSLRIALSGTKFTPPINESMIILGKEETLKRINDALKD